MILITVRLCEPELPLRIRGITDVGGLVWTSVPDEPEWQ